MYPELHERLQAGRGFLLRDLRLVMGEFKITPPPWISYCGPK